MEPCQQKFAEWAHSRPQMPPKDLPVPPSDREMAVRTAPNQTAWGEVVDADVSPAVATVPLPNESEAPTVVTPIHVPSPVVPSGTAAVAVPPSSDADVAEREVGLGGDAELARTPVAGGSSKPLSQVLRCVHDEFFRLGRSVPASVDAVVAKLPELLRFVESASTAAVDPDSAAFWGEYVTQLMDERNALELQVATLQARRRDAEAKLVKMSGRLQARDAASREVELRVTEAERHMKLDEEGVRSLEVDVAVGLGQLRDLELTAVGLRADVQRVVAEERERIRMALGELLPRALDAIIAPGAVQGRTEMPFGSVCNFPGLPLMAGAMSESLLATAIPPPTTPTVAEPGSSAGGRTPVSRRSNPGN